MAMIFSKTSEDIVEPTVVNTVSLKKLNPSMAMNHRLNRYTKQVSIRRWDKRKNVYGQKCGWTRICGTNRKDLNFIEGHIARMLKVFGKEAFDNTDQMLKDNGFIWPNNSTISRILLIESMCFMMQKNKHLPIVKVIAWSIENCQNSYSRVFRAPKQISGGNRVDHVK